MNALLKSLITVIYPSQCRHCDESLTPSDGHYICKSCWQQVEFIEKPYCEVCGFPLNPGAALTDKVSSCDRCREREKGIKTWFRKARSIAYYDSAVGEAIRLLKYSGKTVMAKPLANLMIEAMPAFFGMEDYDYIIPMPSHKKSKRKRGYNQMELIGQRVSRAIGIPIEMRSFIKTRNTRQLAGLSYEERFEEIRNAFDVPDPSELAGKKVLLIDDVFTSGATVAESAKTLARKGKIKYVDVFTLVRRVGVKEHDGM